MGLDNEDPLLRRGRCYTMVVDTPPSPVLVVVDTRPSLLLVVLNERFDSTIDIWSVGISDWSMWWPYDIDIRRHCRQSHSP
jgi:hypothetical protein